MLLKHLFRVRCMWVLYLKSANASLIFLPFQATKRHLSSRIDRVDCKIDECVDNSTATKEEVRYIIGD